MAVELPPGWEMKLLEFMGRSHEVFQREIDTCDKTYQISVAGQVISTEGGAGFSSEKLPASIRTDLIKADAEALSYTISTQILPYYAYVQHGAEAVEAGTYVEFDTNSPADQMVAANVLMTLGNAIEKLQTVLPGADIQELTQRFGVPISDKIETDDRFLPIEEEEEDAATPFGGKTAKNGAQTMKKSPKAA
jgi:phage gp29-like protein